MKCSTAVGPRSRRCPSQSLIFNPSHKTQCWVYEHDTTIIMCANLSLLHTYDIFMSRTGMAYFMLPWRSWQCWSTIVSQRNVTFSRFFKQGTINFQAIPLICFRTCWLTFFDRACNYTIVTNCWVCNTSRITIIHTQTHATTQSFLSKTDDIIGVIIPIAK